MRQGITTRYLGPTNANGSRYKATARKASDGAWGRHAAMSATVPANYSLNMEANHTRAAKACAAKYGWAGLWVGGGNVNEDGYHYVNLPFVVLDALDDSEALGLGVRDVDWFVVSPREDEE